MERIAEKAAFLKKEFTQLLSEIQEDREPAWGKMRFRQMIEHMSDSVRIANGKDPHVVLLDEETVGKMQHFLRSDKPFRENTPNKLLPETPPAPRNASTEEAIRELQQDIDLFFDQFADSKEKMMANPFFGNLDYEHWVQLLYKHSLHHLRQFGVEVAMRDPV